MTASGAFLFIHISELRTHLEQKADAAVPYRMKNLLTYLSFGLLACGGSATTEQTLAQTPAMPFHDLTALDINGKPFAFSQLKGHKVLVVNTASECGYTRQYKQLQELYEQYKDKGLIIVGFPSNDFGGQEPGDEKAIAAFCEKNYQVTFPMMSKVSTKGGAQHAVYQWLTQQTRNGYADSQVKWNFQKYMINEDGTMQGMLASAEDPLSETVLNWLDGK
jgi:glutathione peroxidase